MLVSSAGPRVERRLAVEVGHDLALVFDRDHPHRAAACVAVDQRFRLLAGIAQLEAPRAEPRIARCQCGSGKQ